MEKEIKNTKITTFNQDKSVIKNLLGYDFKYIETIKPFTDKNGAIQVFSKVYTHYKKDGLKLHKYGDLDFCKFKLNNFTSKEKISGVYLWVINDEIIYIGETANLINRFNQGYGLITPRNCLVGGQRTNCKMNNVLLKAYQSKKEVKIYFCECKNFKEVEKTLLKNEDESKRIITKYNIKDN